MAYDSLGYIPNDEECARELGYSNYDDYLDEIQREEQERISRMYMEVGLQKEYLDSLKKELA